jgi:hypothetical protein
MSSAIRRNLLAIRHGADVLISGTDEELPHSPERHEQVPRQRRRAFVLSSPRQFVIIDSIGWSTALGITGVLLANMQVHELDESYLGTAVVCAIAVQVLGGWVLGVYNGRWAVGSFEEVYGLVVVAFFFTLGVIAAGVLGEMSESLSGAALASPLALGFIV